MDVRPKLDDLRDCQFKRSCAEVEVEHMPVIYVPRVVKTALFVILNLSVFR